MKRIQEKIDETGKYLENDDVDAFDLKNLVKKCLANEEEISRELQDA